MKQIRYPLVEENDLFIGKSEDKAKTSPLLECAGLFVYSPIQRKGILVHWQHRGIEERVFDAITQQLKLKSPYAVIAGCGVPIECLLSDSQPYNEVIEFLTKHQISVKKERVGLDRAVEFKVNFSNGFYRVNYVKCQ